MPALPGTRKMADTPETRMLTSMLAASNLTLEQVMTAARRAGLDVTESEPPLHEDTGDECRKAAPWNGSPDRVTVGEFLQETVAPTAKAASGEEKRGGGLYRTYEPYWRILVDGYPYQHKGSATKSGDRVGADPVPVEDRLFAGLTEVPVRDVTYRQLDEVVKWCVIRAQLDAHKTALRREGRGRAIRHSDQQGARRNAVGALRYFFEQAVRDHVIEENRNRATKLKKPGKKPSSRRAFTASEYQELWEVTARGGDDPELDCLLLETVLVTGARREGLMNLNLNHLDFVRVSMWLDEKNGDVDEVPATLDLLTRLKAFAHARGTTRGTDPVFNFKDAIKTQRPHRLTDRRFDTVHQRWQQTLPWADRLGVTMHWARHHAITTVERLSSSEAIAGRFARHTPESVTRGYDKATGEEVCRVVGLMTGTMHPLADGGW